MYISRVELVWLLCAISVCSPRLCRCLEYLLQSVEDKNAINSLDDISATPAHDAAEFGQLETMLVLVNTGLTLLSKTR